MSMNKRGQAALEFLMTYGWAILVVLVVIGALAYFGVLNPSILLPEKCTLTTGLACKDHQIDSNIFDAISPAARQVALGLVDTEGGVKLSLENGMGSGMYITAITAEGKGTEYFTACTVDLTNNILCVGSTGLNDFADAVVDADADGTACKYGTEDALHIANGESQDIVIPCTSVTDFAGKTKVDFEITYWSDDSSSDFTHTMQGELLARNEKTP